LRSKILHLLLMLLMLAAPQAGIAGAEEPTKTRIFDAPRHVGANFLAALLR